MAPKKGKKKKEKKDPSALTEVDKTFYELIIADLNRKLARLRSHTEELEKENEEIKGDAGKNDEDKTDIIMYLKRILQEKTNEIDELEQRLEALREAKQNETEEFEAKIAAMEQDYNEMHEQLTSENKLLEGKLSALEEFRAQRDDLMHKYEQQEEEMEAQEKRHKRQLYELERKFIISKSELKKDMEDRLLQLSMEFQDASELRIAATTHRVLRENIAVNNELDAMITAHHKLYQENVSLRNKDKTLRHEAELHEVEKKKSLGKVKVQLKIIEQLTESNNYMSETLQKYKVKLDEAGDAVNIAKAAKDTITQLEHKIRLLEQNVHKIKCDRTETEMQLQLIKGENDRLMDVLTEAESCIKEALTGTTESETSLKAAKREHLLPVLLTLLSQSRERRAKRPSLITVDSSLIDDETTYAPGDLGIVPKLSDIRPYAPTRRNICAQTGSSFERFIEFGITEEIYTSRYYGESQNTSEIEITNKEGGEKQTRRGSEEQGSAIGEEGEEEEQEEEEEEEEEEEQEEEEEHVLEEEEHPTQLEGGSGEAGSVEEKTGSEGRKSGSVLDMESAKGSQSSKKGSNEKVASKEGSIKSDKERISKTSVKEGSVRQETDE